MTLLERLNRDDRFASGIGARLTEIREGYARAELTVAEPLPIATVSSRWASLTR